MERMLARRILNVDGMSCASCEMRIENSLRKIDGVIDVKAIFSSSNVYVTYDMNLVALDRLIEEIEKLDYIVKNKESARQNGELKPEQVKEEKIPVSQMLGIGIILFAIYVIIKNTVGFNFIPQVDQSMGFGILFVVGLLTSLHCIAMCGGINLAQCVSYKTEEEKDGKLQTLKPSALYNLGRVISYTVIGGIVGVLGSAVSFTGTAKGIVAILAGIFMVIMGINMLSIFPWLRKLNPKMPKIFGRKIHGSTSRGPLYVGLLNGLMPCGPLQAMQLYALGTGSFTAGALSMFFFSLGTVPLMFGFGAISSLLSSKFTKKMLKVSAVLVVILGIIMVNRGLNLSGVTLASAASKTSGGNVAKIEDNMQFVTIKLDSGRYSPIVVQKGIPVKWTIQADEEDLNGCNNPVTIPKYGIEQRLVPGDNIIEFTPDEEGTITYTCWMGMISSTIKVVDDIGRAEESSDAQSGANAGDAGLSGSFPSGGCCADSAKAVKFRNGNIPTDNISLAKVNDGIQEVTVTVNDEGYSPAVVVLQKGVQAKIKFNDEKINSCNNIVVFPEYQGQLSLEEGQAETPPLVPQQDFTFQCWMNMLHGYVKVVDDIDNVDIEQIKKDVADFEPAAGSSFGMGGCCGG